MGEAAAVPVASKKQCTTSPPTPTSSERVIMGYYGILWESMEINGLFRINHGYPQPKIPH